MARLPDPGEDSGVWGGILNEFLLTAHNEDGNLKNQSVSKSMLSSAVQVSLDRADSIAEGFAPDATTTSKGSIQLAGDLAGTATLPTIRPGAVTGGTGGAIATGTIVNSDISSSAGISQSKVQNLTSDLAGKASTAHTHTIANVTNLQATLDGKANTTDLTAGLAGKANTSHTHTTAAVTDLDTHVSDLIGTKLVPGSNVSISYDEGSGETTISSTAVGGGEPSTSVMSVAGRTGDVVLAANDISSGTIATARLPIGTTASTVAAGDHTHSGATESTSGFMSAADKTKLNTVSVSANNYTHPVGDGNLHVPATGTSNNGSVLKAGATAGSLSWGTLTASDVGLSNVNNTSDLAKPVSTAQQTALNLKANTSDVYTRAQTDAQFVKTVNGVEPDAEGDVTVAGGGGGGGLYSLPTYILEFNQTIDDVPSDFPEGGLVFKKTS